MRRILRHSIIGVLLVSTLHIAHAQVADVMTVTWHPEPRRESGMLPGDTHDTLVVVTATDRIPHDMYLIVDGVRDGGLANRVTITIYDAADTALWGTRLDAATRLARYVDTLPPGATRTYTIRATLDPAATMQRGTVTYDVTLGMTGEVGSIVPKKNDTDDDNTVHDTRQQHLSDGSTPYVIVKGRETLVDTATHGTVLGIADDAVSADQEVCNPHNAMILAIILCAMALMLVIGAPWLSTAGTAARTLVLLVTAVLWLFANPCILAWWVLPLVTALTLVGTLIAVVAHRRRVVQ